MEIGQHTNRIANQISLMWLM